MSAAQTGEVRDAATEVADDAACKWRPSGEFAMVHPSGWSIARYSVYGQWRYLLWEPINRCTAANASQFHGPFDNVRDAMRLHRDLTAPATTGDGGMTKHLKFQAAIDVATY